MQVEKYTGGKNGQYTYLKLVENYWDKEAQRPRKRTIQLFGRLDKLQEQYNDPNIYETLRAKYEEKSELRKAQKQEERMKDVCSFVNEIDKFQTVPNSSIDDGFATLCYGHYPLKKLWVLLGLEQNLKYLEKHYSKAKFSHNNLFFFMTACKVLDPASIRYQFSTRDSFLGNPAGKNATEQACYHSLDFFAEHKDSIFKSLNKNLDDMFGKDRSTLIFYDVTNTYFETPLTDGEKDYQPADYQQKLATVIREEVFAGHLPKSCLSKTEIGLEELPPDVWDRVQNKCPDYFRMRGPSKERRKDLPLVSVALVMDKNGFPMDYEVFAGNRSEFKSMRQAVESLQKKYAFLKTILVADRGLNSAENLCMLQDKGLGFVVAQKISNLGPKYTEELKDLKSYRPINPKDESIGKFKVLPNYLKVCTSDPSKSISTNLIFTFNEARKARDNVILENWKALVEEKAAKSTVVSKGKAGWLSIAKTKLVWDEEEKISPQEQKEINLKVKKAKRIVTGVDFQALEKKKELSGFYGMVFREPGEQQEWSEEELFNKGRHYASLYHQLNRIEECFLIMKSHLGFRPVHVWTPNHIKGHIGICVLGLLMLRLLQIKLQEQNVKVSINEITRMLGQAELVVVPTPSETLYFRLRANKNLRKGNERIGNSEFKEKLEKNEVETNQMAKIMEVVGLRQMPRISTKADLEKSLKTRFYSDEDIMSPALRSTIEEFKIVE